MSDFLIGVAQALGFLVLIWACFAIPVAIGFWLWMRSERREKQEHE
jgi:hypothetical protein